MRLGLRHLIVPEAERSMLSLPIADKTRERIFPQQGEVNDCNYRNAGNESNIDLDNGCPRGRRKQIYT